MPKNTKPVGDDDDPSDNSAAWEATPPPSRKNHFRPGIREFVHRWYPALVMIFNGPLAVLSVVASLLFPFGRR